MDCQPVNPAQHSGEAIHQNKIVEPLASSFELEPRKHHHVLDQGLVEDR